MLLESYQRCSLSKQCTVLLTLSNSRKASRFSFESFTKILGKVKHAKFRESCKTYFIIFVVRNRTERIVLQINTIILPRTEFIAPRDESGDLIEIWVGLVGGLVLIPEWRDRKLKQARESE